MKPIRRKFYSYLSELGYADTFDIPDEELAKVLHGWMIRKRNIKELEAMSESKELETMKNYQKVMKEFGYKTPADIPSYMIDEVVARMIEVGKSNN